MKKRVIFLATALILAVLPVLAAGNAGEPGRIPSVEGKIKVDGQLDEALWQEALNMPLSYEVEPGENTNPPVKTEVFLAYGSRHIYVAFRAHDPNPSRIRARVTDRDNIADDDQVGIVLDTFNDSRRAYQFFCNPFGIQADSIMTLMGGGGQWDAIWNSAGKITEDGYVVEMAIPFTSLRFQGKKEDQIWGIDAVRIYPRNLTHEIGLFPRDRNNNCYMCQARKIIGFKGARPGANLEFDPTLSGVVSRERGSFPDGDFGTSRKEVEAGLTARWSFTPNMTLNGTVNPDFSHVEADAAQLDLNTATVLFYPEKRPFFLEGASLFMSRFFVIYSRTVADPEWGVKLTGKEGKHGLAFFTARDRVSNFIFPTSQTSDFASFDMPNTSSALRYRIDVGRSSNLGFVMTNRVGEDYYNRVGGIDGNVRFTKTDRVSFQFLGSQTRYPDWMAQAYNQQQGRFNSGALDIMYAHETRNFFAYAHYQDVKPGFRADVGFADQCDDIMMDGGIGYTWRRSAGHWFTQLRAMSTYLYMKDHNNQLLLERFNNSITYRGPMQSFVQVQYGIGKRAFMGGEFDDNNMSFNIFVRPSASISLGLNGQFGDQVDYSNVQQGSRLRLNPVILYNVGRHLTVSFDHLYEALDVDGGRLYTANLSNIRLVYQFNSRAFLRTLFQFADFDYSPELYSFPINDRFKHLFSQVLFSYKLNPQTVLFLGYSDDYYGYSMTPMKQNNHTFFLKVGYALVM